MSGTRDHQREHENRALADRAQAGDDHAFRELYQRYAPLLVPRLRRLLRHRADVEDVLQMTFIEAHRSLAGWRRENAFGAWLHGIAFNVTGVFLRGKKRRWWSLSDSQMTIDRAPSLTASSEREVVRNELAEQFEKALAKLPEKKRIAFVLHDVEGLGLAEIGELTGATPQTLSLRVRSARELVRRHFERLGYDPSMEIGG